VRPNAAASTWITEALAIPNADPMPARRPCPMQHDRMNKIDGPGETLSAKDESMNRTIVLALGTTMFWPLCPACQIRCERCVNDPLGDTRPIDTCGGD
jgi:hypothetical protein